MKAFAICLATITMALPAATLAQDAVQAPDEPMRELFKAPGVVAYITTPHTDPAGHAHAWTWLFLKQPIPAGADNLAMEWDFDCTARTARTVHTALYNGETHMRTEAGQGPAAAPAAGSPGAVALGAACAPPARSRITPVPGRSAARTAATALFAAQP